MVPQKRHQNEILKLVTTWIYNKTSCYTRKIPPKKGTISRSCGWDSGPKNRGEKSWRLRKPQIDASNTFKRPYNRTTEFYAALMAIYQKAEHLYALLIFPSIEELVLQMTTASVSRWHFAPQDPASRKLHTFDWSKECFVPHPSIFQLITSAHSKNF